MKKLITICAVMLFLVASASAQPTVDNFSISLQFYNEFIGGSGTGFNDGTGVNGTPWYYYSYPADDWYAQWFYDDPPDPDRYKEITYDINIGGTISDITIAIMWTWPTSPETGPDGPPPLPGIAAGYTREVIYDEHLHGSEHITGTLVIPNYNPEWVSIGVSGYGHYTFVRGTITHECIIPAPGAVILGGIGVSLVGWLRRRGSI